MVSRWRGGWVGLGREDYEKVGGGLEGRGLDVVGVVWCAHEEWHHCCAQTTGTRRAM